MQNRSLFSQLKLPRGMAFYTWWLCAVFLAAAVCIDAGGVVHCDVGGVRAGRGGDAGDSQTADGGDSDGGGSDVYAACAACLALRFNTVLFFVFFLL